MKIHRTLTLLGLAVLTAFAPWPGPQGRAHCAEEVAMAAAASETSVPPPKKIVRENRLAGRWYPATPAALTELIDKDLAAASDVEPVATSLRALIVPHAGYQFSGGVAAYAYHALQGKQYRRIVIIGPTHHMALENLASVDDATHYVTPLGEIPLDREFIAALQGYPYFKTLQRSVEGEHSVQIQLPFLQRALGADFTLVPIVVGQLDAETVDAMAQVLLGLVDDQTLVVVSSDFTHYGPNYGFVPFRDDVEKNLRKLDLGAFDAIAHKDPQAFDHYVQTAAATICGHDPIRILLAMAGSDMKAALLKYDASGRIVGDWTNSVSYLAIALTGAWSKPASLPRPAGPLTDDDQKTLLRLARAALSQVVEHPQESLPQDPGVSLSPALKANRAAFVTLKIHGALRGCIGEIEPTQPLYRSVIEGAVNAARRDPRFAPVRPDELAEIEIDISALTPPRPVDSIQEIVLGKHGIILEKDGRRALFLPQVAPEQRWDLDTTLSHLAQKAGLSPDAYRTGARFQVFEAEVFAE